MALSFFYLAFLRTMQIVRVQRVRAENHPARLSRLFLHLVATETMWNISAVSVESVAQELAIRGGQRGFVASPPNPTHPDPTHPRTSTQILESRCSTPLDGPVPIGRSDRTRPDE
jgi:hypothetical protein